MQIGTYRIDPPVVLAPMAGVTDKPFRLPCTRLGADLAVSEMTHADPRRWQARKSRRRMDHVGEPELARFNVASGARLIDIARIWPLFDAGHTDGMVANRSRRSGCGASNRCSAFTASDGW